jgi:hypothetical protein
MTNEKATGMMSVDLAPPPASKVETQAIRLQPTSSGVGFLRIVVGCEVRHEDMIETKIVSVPDCVHLRTDKELSEFLYRQKEKAHGGRVSCIHCGNEVGGQTVKVVMRHNQLPPSRPFPVYFDHFNELQVTRMYQNSMTVEGVVLVGRFFLDMRLPGVRTYTAPTTEFIENAKALLKKHGMLNSTFGVYLVGAQG